MKQINKKEVCKIMNKNDDQNKTKMTKEVKRTIFTIIQVSLMLLAIVFFAIYFILIKKNNMLYLSLGFTFNGLGLLFICIRDKKCN